MTVDIQGKLIGESTPCYITFEAGPTHDGLSSAKELVRRAASAGADAIKFQILDPDRLVSDKKQLFDYEILLSRESGETEKVSEPLYDILKRRALTLDEWKEVKEEADKSGLAFVATVGFEDELDLLCEIGCDSIKIASADVNHIPLLRLAARTGLCIQLDTGNSTLGEIEQAVDVITGCGNERIIIHQCPTGYPARLESINLNMIRTLKQLFPFPIAFSDHTPGWDMDIAALAVGADLLEKTITLDRTTRSVEHIMSIEGRQLSEFVRAIREVEVALGGSRRSLSKEHLEKRKSIRRSAYAAHDLSVGTILSAEDIEYRRPGYGIEPTLHDSLLGAKVIKHISSGSAFQYSDIEF